jgi:hypothetical protein
MPDPTMTLRPGMTDPWAPAPASTATTPTCRSPRPPAGLHLGDEGPAVRALQRQLLDLGYWLRSDDGVFGHDTAHAVTALQKATDLVPDGVAGPATVETLARTTRPRPVNAHDHVIEVDLRRQLVLVADEGRATHVLDASTGAVADSTPLGHHHVRRTVDRFDFSPHGTLYRPLYLDSGVAIHGYASVPTIASSHGSIRITNGAMDLLWATGAAPVGTHVWIH